MKKKNNITPPWEREDPPRKKPPSTSGEAAEPRTMITPEEIAQHRAHCAHNDTPTYNLIWRLLDEIEILTASNARAHQVAQKQKERADKAEAIVARLPKTADGVPMIPMVDEVWGVHEGEIRKVTWRPIGKNGQCEENPADDFWIEYPAYSTREAAEAAKGGAK